LADVLRSAGLEVLETSAWQTRGHGDMGFVKGVMLHHTAGPLTGNMPSLNTLIEGRPDLGGPLCNLGLGRDGTYFAIAAGKAWHAGVGAWMGITSGNSQFIGIEAENTGLPNDPWPEKQLRAYVRGVAALLKHVGAPPSMCVAHREYALPPGRKADPDFDMPSFRAQLALEMQSAS
jgi:hypothetical protein